jgi:hypothetical protein
MPARLARAIQEEAKARELCENAPDRHEKKRLCKTHRLAATALNELRQRAMYLGLQ